MSKTHIRALWPWAAAALLAVSASGLAEETEIIVVVGQANLTAGGDPEQAALAHARREAMEKLVNRIAGPEALFADDGALEERILAAPDRFVVSVKKLDEKRRGTWLKLKVEVTVNVAGLRRELTTMGMLKDSMDDPRIMILPDPESPGTSPEGPRVQGQIAKNLAARRFDLVDPVRSQEIGQFAQRVVQFRDYAEGAETPGVALAQDLLLRYDCDAIIYCSIQEDRGGRVEQINDPTGLGELYQQFTGARVRIITNDRASILAADERNDKAVAGSPHAARLKAAERLGKKLSDYVAEQVISWWKSGIARMELNVHAHNVDMRYTRQIADKIRQMPGVENVTQRRSIMGERSRESATQFLVKYRGRVTDFVAALDDAFDEDRDEYDVFMNSMGRFISLSLLDPEQLQREQALGVEIGRGKNAFATATEKVVAGVRDNAVLIQHASGMGSGFFVSRDGLVLTNAHVVGEAKKVSIRTASGLDYPAAVVKLDRTADLAVLKAEGISDAKAATLGDSNTLRVGQPVICIGHPLSTELQFSVSNGIVAGLGRGPRGLVQTNAILYPGCSGGPMYDLQGQVVAIHVAGWNTKVHRQGAETQPDLSVRASGLSLSIPINRAKPLLP